MRLRFEPFDGRGFNHRPIIDENTGQQVGYIKSNGVGMYSGGGIEVSLFDHKYGITVNRYEQALGFVQGVEAVLNHVTHIKARKIKSEAA